MRIAAVVNAFVFLVMGIAGFLPLHADAAAAVNRSDILTIRVLPLAEGSVPRGAQRVEMLRLELTAPCVTDTTLSSMTLFHRGIGDTAEIERVYAAIGGRRITRSSAIEQSDGEVTLRFQQYTLARCTKVILSILTDISADAVGGGEHRFVLASSSDVDAAGTPVRLERRSASSSKSLPISPRRPFEGGTRKMRLLQAH